MATLRDLSLPVVAHRYFFGIRIPPTNPTLIASSGVKSMQTGSNGLCSVSDFAAGAALGASEFFCSAIFSSIESCDVDTRVCETESHSSNHRAYVQLIPPIWAAPAHAAIQESCLQLLHTWNPSSSLSECE